MRDLTVVIATLDEEMHIERCVQSVIKLARVVVVDSGSSDRTVRLAEGLGAQVVSHDWEGYAAQKNWALAQLVLSKWVLFLDADEWITPQLSQELAASIESDSYSGYFLPRMNTFMGQRLVHAWWYPDHQLRLFRSNAGSFERRLVHEHVVVSGEIGFLMNPIEHENLKGTDAFLERHVKYARLEAQQLLLGNGGEQRRGSWVGSWPERRRVLKDRVWFRLPFRPQVRFLWMYVLRRGFLDGRAGLVYCQLIAAYETMIDAFELEYEQLQKERRADGE